LSFEPHLQVHFARYFEDGISCTISTGWPKTFIFPLSASQVAKITSVSHQCPVEKSFYNFKYKEKESETHPNSLK
jgi:hypothetical protein